MRGKILVIRGGAIGDFILTLPAVTALRERFASAHLEVLGYPHIARLALAAGLVDRVQPIEARGLAGFFARHGELEEDLKDYFSEFDLILSYLYDPDSIFQENVCRCATGQFIAAPHRAQESERVHAAKVYLKPLERLAIFDADPVPRLKLDTSGSGNGKTNHGAKRATIALHPGSGSEAKNWPEQNWAALLQHLAQARPYELLLVGGEAEGDRLQRLAALLPPGRLRLAQSLDLVELGRRLQHSLMFIGHDSGISHLAAALGLSGILLWGITSEEIWRPPSQRMTILRHAQGLEHLSLAAVLKAIEHKEKELVGIAGQPARQ